MILDDEFCRVEGGRNIGRYHQCARDLRTALPDLLQRLPPAEPVPQAVGAVIDQAGRSEGHERTDDTARYSAHLQPDKTHHPGSCWARGTTCEIAKKSANSRSVT